MSPVSPSLTIYLYQHFHRLSINPFEITIVVNNYNYNIATATFKSEKQQTSDLQKI